MGAFPKTLKELMDEKPIGIKSLANILGFNEVSIYRWLNGSFSLSLVSAVKIADYFDCSLDYLFGRSNEYKNGNYKECTPFDVQFKKVIKEQKISQYKLTKSKIISGGNIDNWLNKKQTPNIESVIKLCDYLNVGMDYLVGRER